MWVSPSGVYSFKMLHNRWRFTAVELVEYKWMHINSDITLTAGIKLPQTADMNGRDHRWRSINCNLSIRCCSIATIEKHTERIVDSNN